MGIEVGQAQRHGNVDVLFVAVVETLNFLVFPLGDGEADIVGVADRGQRCS